MNLEDIEKNIRKNFIFNKEEQTDRENAMPNEWRIVKTELCRNESAAIIVFIGISYLYGFDRSIVINHLGISVREHTYYINKFKQAATEYDISQYHPLLKTDVNQYIIAKAQMSLSYLNILDKNKHISLADFEF